MDLIAELSAVVRRLDEAEIPYALCGGLAVAFHGYVRATQDIDLLIRAEHLDAVFHGVNGIGYNLEDGNLPAGFGETHPCEIHQISKAIGKLLVTRDLLIVNPWLEPVWESRLKSNWQGRDLWVVSIEGLGVMKRLSRGPIDLADLGQLGTLHDDE